VGLAVDERPARPSGDLGGLIALRLARLEVRGLDDARLLAARVDASSR
jgi:hypothetical protein